MKARRITLPKATGRDNTRATRRHTKAKPGVGSTTERIRKDTDHTTKAPRHNSKQSDPPLQADNV